MTYELNKSDGTLLLELADGATDKSFSNITFIGKNVVNYGASQNENFLYLLENFANTQAPSNPLIGQLWFDEGTKRLKVNDGSLWNQMPSIVYSNTATNQMPGDLWFNTDTRQLSIKTVSSYTLIGPNSAATTAQRLLKPAHINGVSFDGSADITLSASAPHFLIAGNSLSGQPFNGSTNVTWSVYSESENVPNTIISRDANGDFSARNINVTTVNATTVNANASSASKWNAPINVSLAGAISGTVTVDGTTDVTIQTRNTGIVIPNSIPPGGIIMWSGSADVVPSGWVLCDGTNGTPDLRDRFVIGAGNRYPVHTIGGNKDAIVPAHSHSANSVVNDPGHTHTYQTATATAPQSGRDTQCYFSSLNSLVTGRSTTGITVNTTVNSAGVSVNDANLPPFLALCYIMKL